MITNSILGGRCILAMLVLSLGVLGCGSSGDGGGGSGSGSGGSGSGSGQNTGMGGSTGQTGTGGSSNVMTACDAPTMVLKPTCGVAGCHEPTDTAFNAGLDFSKTTGVVAELLGKMSPGINGSACGTSTEPYLVPGSNPASGLMIDKLFGSPPCGLSMPFGGSMLSASDAACVKNWAVAVTTGVIKQ